MNLTNDAKKLLYLMYKEYKKRRKSGIGRAEARNFDSSATIRESLSPDETIEDIDDMLKELFNAGYVNGLWADDVCYAALTLTNQAVQELEQAPAKTLESAASFLANFIP